MKQIYILTKRHLMLYFFDKMNVFYTLLAALIALALFVMFMFEQHVDSFVRYFDANRVTVSILMLKWFLSGQIVLLIFSASFSMMSYYLTDMEYNASDLPFLPVSTNKKVLSYTFAASVVAIGFALMVLLITQFYLYAKFSVLLDVKTVIYMLIIIIIGSIISSLFAFVCATTVKTLRAYGSLQSIINTLMGFLLGMYVSVDVFPTLLQNLLAWNPYYAIVTLLRKVLVGKEFSQLLSSLSPTTKKDILFAYGLQVKTWGFEWTSIQIISYIVLFGMFILFVAIRKTKKKNYQR